MKKKAVQVTWLDPYSVDEWTSLDRLRECRPMIVESFGYEIHRDDSVTIIGLNVDFEDEMEASCCCVIPNGCIKRYRYVKE